LRRLKLIGFCVVLAILITLASSQFVPDKPSQWYTLEPWEIDVCSKWGGRTAPAQTQVVEEGLTGFGPFTYSLFGKKALVPGENETLYIYAYYLESYSVLMDYSIDLFNAQTQRRQSLESGTLGVGDNTLVNKAEYLNEEYTHIRIIHQFGQTMMPLEEAT